MDELDDTPSGDEAKLAAGRTAALTDDASLDRVTFEHKGELFELRSLPLASQRAIRAKALEPTKDKDGKLKKGADGQPVLEVNSEKAMALSLIASIYLPGTEKRYLNKADLEQLLKAPTSKGSFMGKAIKAIEEMNAVKVEEEEKNSESDPTSDSSFE